MRRFDTERPDATAIGAWVDRSIKWTSELERHLVKGDKLSFTEENVSRVLYRPFVNKHSYFAPVVTHRRYQMPQIFPGSVEEDNKVICFQTTGGRRPFAVLATDKLVDYHVFFDGAQCLPLYRYTPDGERVSNITDWGISRINDHFRKEWRRRFDKIYPNGIDAEEIFAYTYAVLHDPVYRHDYANDLLREFPRLPLYHDFDLWAKMGRELLRLHIGFESTEPFDLERRDSRLSGDNTPRPILKADKEKGLIFLDENTTLAGVPPDAWRYELGSRSALEWVLDQYKEKKPRDPTIREKFNTYRFADHKERVIDLLKRVCTVSVKTMDVVDDMAYWDEGELIVFGDRDKHEWTMMALQSMFSRPEDEEWLAEWASMPDIYEQEQQAN